MWIDDEYAAEWCSDEPEEGCFYATEWVWDGEPDTDGPDFLPAAEEDDWYGCGNSSLEPGVVASMGRQSVEWEMRIDLESSHLNCVEPGAGDCFRFYADVEEAFCPAEEGESCTEPWEDGPEWAAGGRSGRRSDTRAGTARTPSGRYA